MHEGSQRLTKGLSSVVFSLSPFQTEGFPFSFPVQGLNLSDSKAFKSPFSLRLHPPKAAVLAPRGLRCRDRLLDSRRSGSLVSGKPPKTPSNVAASRADQPPSLGESRRGQVVPFSVGPASSGVEKAPLVGFLFGCVFVCVCVIPSFIWLIGLVSQRKKLVLKKRRCISRKKKTARARRYLHAPALPSDLQLSGTSLVGSSDRATNQRPWHLANHLLSRSL